MGWLTNKQFSKEETLMVCKYLKNCLKSLRPRGHENYNYFEIMSHPSQNYQHQNR